ncbi:AMP-dependent synthetase/ligase domain-containing protein [Strongyloides ratti]|uniref:long-chain-fatty-acid--CoA ligase n=1 Tax=Strongyloides ratti TaxID=34506 RepID=A0A090L380_STRRB|nr:AMP-dependent synthetase/ligase domain-containing protein [Strongyloides ratti]CEF64167.1 AMP-dependent synthetase/ligase domain-containing protein [Strongyloides ratti]
MYRFTKIINNKYGRCITYQKKLLHISTYFNNKISDGHQPTIHEMLTHPHDVLDKHQIFTQPTIPKLTKLALLGVEGLFKLCDILSYLPDKITGKSAKILKERQSIKSLSINPNDKSGPYRYIDTLHTELTTTPYEGISTLKELLQYVHQNYGTKDSLGEREITELYSHFDNVETQLVKLGEYKFITYNQLTENLESIKNYLHKIGIKKGDTICIYAETRVEWLTMALACFSQGYVVVTAYSTLGKDAVKTIINETNCKVIVATESYFNNLKDIINDMPSLEGMIYFRERFRQSKNGNNLPSTKDERIQIPDEICKQLKHIYHYDDLLKNFSKKNEYNENLVLPDDVALIMYTSGSTGTPKGVPCKHKSLIATLSGLVNHIKDFNFTTMIAYLPLSHIIELSAELCFITMGKKIGYSSPLTLIDTSTKILPGSTGDASVLKPQFFVAVPAILNRIKKAVNEKIKNESIFKQKLFQMCYDRKVKKFHLGRNTPIIDRVIFKKIKNLLGGEANLIFTGGSALDAETHRFVSTCLLSNDGIIMQAYGSTEGSISSTMSINDTEVGTVGYPLTSSEVLLKSWEEGNYFVEDVNPRGEILISGTPVFDGYFSINDDDIFYNSHGKKWYCTGDIGEIKPNGSLSIIDRKKDLVKLTTAEYIPLGKVESNLLTSPYIDQVCVVGKSTMDYLVAIIVVNEKNLCELAASTGHKGSLEELCMNKALRTLIVYSLEEKFKNILHKSEIPRKVILETTPWTVESGLLTDSMKIKRKVIEKKYEKVLDKVYRPFEENINSILKL